MEALNGREGHPFFIHRGDVTFVGADLKFAKEILGHGADMAGGGIGFVLPGGDGQTGDALEDGAFVHRGEVLLGVAIAGAIEGAARGHVAVVIDRHDILGAIPKGHGRSAAAGHGHVPGRAATDAQAQAGVIIGDGLFHAELRRIVGGGDVDGTLRIVGADPDPAGGPDEELVETRGGVGDGGVIGQGGAGSIGPDKSALMTGGGPITRGKTEIAGD